MGAALLDCSQAFAEAAIPAALHGLAHQQDRQLQRDARRMQLLPPETLARMRFPRKAELDFGYRALAAGDSAYGGCGVDPSFGAMEVTIGVKQQQKDHCAKPAFWNDSPKLNSSIESSCDRLYPYLRPASKPCDASADFDAKRRKLYELIAML